MCLDNDNTSLKQGRLWDSDHQGRVPISVAEAVAHGAKFRSNRSMRLQYLVAKGVVLGWTSSGTSRTRGATASGAQPCFTAPVRLMDCEQFIQ